MTIVNYAHRGASGHCPENTMIAFKKAIELGATGIETDVQMTADGTLVLIHDYTLARTTGVQAYVKDVTYEEIKSLDAGSWFDEKFSAATIPTLEELLQLCKDNQLKLNIEIKNGLVQYPNIEQKVIELVEQYGLADEVIISNFNHYSLKLCESINPSIQTGILYTSGLYEPWHYAKTVGATALHAPKYATFAPWVEEAAKHQCIYNVYTVNDEKEMMRLIEANVAGIITDYPDKLASLLNKS